MAAEEKAEILELVRKSPLSIGETLKQLGIPRSTYYAWRQREETAGMAGLRDGKPAAQRIWNRLREEEVQTVLDVARKYPEESPRELAFRITDAGRFSVSESTVYRILKREGLILPAMTEEVRAAKEYHQKTTRVHQMWQTDLTYFFVPGWGWYYLGGIIDDYSRYLICFEVVRDMTGPTLSDLVQKAIEITGMTEVPVQRRVRLLSDNGSGYISKAFNEYLSTLGVRHLFASRCHPQTCGKIERLNRTAKDRLGLISHPTPEHLQRAIAEFCDWYNNQRYHEAIGNLRPIEVYEGRAARILRRREQLKRKTIQQRRESNLLTA
jgi:transposase InsO family protein